MPQCRSLSGHCVTSWSIRLNPLSAGLPLLELPRVATAAPGAGKDAWLKQLSLKYFGFEDGFHAADLLSRCDGRLRSFSAVQWTGLKDAFPASPDFLVGRIKQWVAEQEPWWLERESMLVAIQASTKQGLALLEPYVTSWPTAALWWRAGKLQQDYLELLQQLFVAEIEFVSLRQKLLTFQKQAEAFFGCEQSPDSAARNVGLIVDLLLDYSGRMDPC